METFVSDQHPRVWSIILENYRKAIDSKASRLKADKKNDLNKLDLWYQNELPGQIRGRKPRHITRDEICQLMKWKLTRGKFRPRLTELVQANTEDEVKDASTKAFKELPNMHAAIQALTVLKAVGPATASAVLAAGAPEQAAFMADECMHALPGLQPIKYDLPFYMTYLQQVKQIVKSLNKQDPDKSWTPHKVELALWTYQVIKTLDANLYQKLSKTIDTLDKQSDVNTLVKTSEGPPKKKVKKV